MTLIVGYIFKGTVQIVVDSAETIYGDTEKVINDKNFFDSTSFGDSVPSRDEDIVIENAQKIFVLQDKILCAFSGSVYEATLLIQDLRISLQFRKEPISKILLDFFSGEGRKPSFLIAFYEDGNPMLFEYINSNNFGFILHNL